MGPFDFFSVRAIRACLLVCWLSLVLSLPQANAEDISIARETKLGQSVAKEIEERWERVNDVALLARVETILQKQRPYLVRSLDYEVRIVDTKMVNAFSLPGGITYVTTAMLDFVKTDHELAGVIAHELVHADRRHVMQQVARNQRLTLLALAIAIASRGEGAALLATSVAQTAIMSAYSIDFEKEADSYGISVMSNAGYNPSGMLTLQERLLEEQLKKPHFDPGIAQSHPEARERILAAVRFMEGQDIAIQRKVTLGLLKVAVAPLSEDIALTVDGVPFWKGVSNDINLRFFTQVKERLDESLQLETAPYDVRLQNGLNGQVLWIGPRKIVETNAAPPDVESVVLIRDRIQTALENARQQHPLANYY